MDVSALALLLLSEEPEAMNCEAFLTTRRETIAKSSQRRV